MKPFYAAPLTLFVSRAERQVNHSLHLVSADARGHIWPVAAADRILIDSENVNSLIHSSATLQRQILMGKHRACL